MSAQARWAEVRAVARAALALPSAVRAAFLDRACAHDATLRVEVDALLEACEQASSPDVGFLAGPASAYAAPLLRSTAPPADAEDAAAIDALRAALAGRYDIERELGRGGTATVYRARDLRHGRHVAIKVVDPAVGAALSAERFLREIRVTASLAHPHILPLHDSGEAAGLLYFVMPHLEGETLRARLARDGRLRVPDALRLLRELADALAYAHGRGVIHRDIKPANILLHGEHAVVADFGIARALGRARAAEREQPDDETSHETFDGLSAERATAAPSITSHTLTAAGVSPGTPAYMAPEQVGGGAIDERTDLYALGVVAYEMLTGAHPFGVRPPGALIEAHRSETPPPLAAHAPDVPPALAALVLQLLAKSPADRPPSAQALLDALAAIAEGSPHATGRTHATARSHATRRTRTGVLAGLALVLAVGVGGFLLTRDSGEARDGRAVAIGDSQTGATPTLAVLPFTNTGGDPEDEYFSDGLTDDLTHALRRTSGLRLAGRTSSYAYKGRDVPAPEIGRALGVAALVSGTVRRVGDRMRVSAQLVSTTDGTVQWDSVFEARSGDVFALQDELTRAIVAALAPALRGGADAVASAGRGTSDPEAYELYLKGRWHFLLRGPENAQRAIVYFRRAIERDPGFARAHAGLTLALRLLPVYQAIATDSLVALMDASARRAVALDSTLADAQLAMAISLELQLRFREALARNRAAVALDPSSATAHLNYGFALLHMGHNDEAVVELNRALQLDPLVISTASGVALSYVWARRYPEAIVAARNAFALDSMFPLAILVRGVSQELGGQADSAVLTLERGTRLHPDDTRLLTYLVFAYAAVGRWDDAQRIRERLHRPDTRLIDGTEAARADLVFGDPDPLIRILTSSEGLRRNVLGGIPLGCNPFNDPLWSDARFRAAMRGLGIEPCPLTEPWPLRAPPTTSM